MGILGNLFDGDAPQRQTADYDPYSKQIMASNVSSAESSPDQRYAAIDQNLSSGNESYGKLSGINDAIKEKYGRNLSTDLNNLGAQYKMQDRQMNAQRIEKAQNAVIAKQSVQNDAYASLLQAQTMQEAARSQAISSVVGLGAMGAAMAFGGGGPQGSRPGAGVKYAGSFGENTDGTASYQGDMLSPGMNHSMAYRDRLHGIGSGGGIYG